MPELASVAPSIVQCYRVHGTNLAIRADSVEPLEWLRRRLRHFPDRNPDSVDFEFDFQHAPHLCDDPEAGSPSASYRPVYEAPEGGQVVYQDETDQLIMTFENRVRVCCEFPAKRIRVEFTSPLHDSLRIATYPLFTLALMELMKRRGRYALHAATLCWKDRGLLIAGTSGAGKTTLALTLLRSGFGFLGDDLGFLATEDGGLRVLAFPDEIDVSDQTIDFFPELSFLRKRSLPPGRTKWPLLAEEVYDADIVTSCRPTVVLLPSISGEAESRIEPVDSARALLEVAPNVLLTDPMSSQRHLDALGRLVREVDCYRLHAGHDFGALPVLLRELVE